MLNSQLVFCQTYQRKRRNQKNFAGSLAKPEQTEAVSQFCERLDFFSRNVTTPLHALETVLHRSIQSLPAPLEETRQERFNRVCGGSRLTTGKIHDAAVEHALDCAVNDFHSHLQIKRVAQKPHLGSYKSLTKNFCILMPTREEADHLFYKHMS